MDGKKDHNKQRVTYKRITVNDIEQGIANIDPEEFDTEVVNQNLVRLQSNPHTLLLEGGRATVNL